MLKPFFCIRGAGFWFFCILEPAFGDSACESRVLVLPFLLHALQAGERHALQAFPKHASQAFRKHASLCIPNSALYSIPQLPFIQTFTKHAPTPLSSASRTMPNSACLTPPYVVDLTGSATFLSSELSL
jgi:hypothetical protein